jgi:hypothetical protein
MPGHVVGMGMRDERAWLATAEIDRQLSLDEL